MNNTNNIAAAKCSTCKGRGLRGRREVAHACESCLGSGKPIVSGVMISESSIPVDIANAGGGWFAHNGRDVYVCCGAHMVGDGCVYGWMVKEIR